MEFNISSSWRGVVGCVKPTYRPGNLEAFIRLLPLGIGVIPMYYHKPGVKLSNTMKERLERLELAKERAAELATLKVDLIHLESAPFLMIHGYKGGEEIISGIEKKHGIPVFSSGQSQVGALRALGIKRLVAATYLGEEITQKCAQYMSEAGFEVLCFETLHSVGYKYEEIGRINPNNVYSFLKALYLKHKDKNVQGIYMLGSGWPILDIIQILEQDLQLPVVAAVPARIWDIQKRLHVRQPIKGYGRLLEELP